MMSWALLLHLAFSAWVYSSPVIYPSTRLSVGDLMSSLNANSTNATTALDGGMDSLNGTAGLMRLQDANALPLVVLFAILLAVLLATKTAGRIVKMVLVRVLAILTCGKASAKVSIEL